MIIVGNIYAGLNSSGGGGTVNTDNGISGDGSVGTPVILGGKPLNQGTIIQLAGFALDFSDSDGTNNFQQTNSLGNWSVAQANAGFESIMSVLLSGGNFSAGMAFVNLSSGNLKQVAVNNTQTGILVTDSIDDVGLLDSDLHPITDPRQYAQYGNIAAGVSGAESGTHITAGKVRLGGTLLAGTIVDTGNFNFNLVTTDGNGLVTTFQQAFAGIQSWKIVNGISNAGITLGDIGAFAKVLMSINDGGVIKFIQMGEGDIGIPVHDDSGVGLIGNALFPVSDPTQYAQYGNLVVPQNFALPLGSGNRTALTYVVTGGDACIQVNCSLSTSVAAVGGASVALNYTDINGNAQSKVLVLDAGVIGNYPANTITIEAQNGTNVTVDVTAAGGEVYRVVGAIQRFF